MQQVWTAKSSMLKHTIPYHHMPLCCHCRAISTKIGYLSLWTAINRAKTIRLFDYYVFALSVSLFLWLVCCIGGPNLPWLMSKWCETMLCSFVWGSSSFVLYSALV
jgi:hypothetical protein